jgi:hypothetical protein
MKIFRPICKFEYLLSLTKGPRGRNTFTYFISYWFQKPVLKTLKASILINKQVAEMWNLLKKLNDYTS